MVIPVSHNATNALISLLLMYSANLMQSLVKLNETSSERIVQPQLLMIEKETEVEKEEKVKQSKSPEQKNYSSYRPQAQQRKQLQNGIKKLKPNYALSYRPPNGDMNDEDRQYSPGYYPKYDLSYHQSWGSRKHHLPPSWKVIDDSQYQNIWDPKYHGSLSSDQNGHLGYLPNWNSVKVEHQYSMNTPDDQQGDDQELDEQEPSEQEAGEQEVGEQEANEQEAGEQEPGEQEPDYRESNGKEFDDQKLNEKEALSLKNMSTYIQPILHLSLIPLKALSSPLPVSINSSASKRNFQVYTDSGHQTKILKPKLANNDLESENTLRSDKIENSNLEVSEANISERNDPAQESSDHYLESKAKEAASFKSSSKLQKADVKGN